MVDLVVAECSSFARAVLGVFDVEGDAQTLARNKVMPIGQGMAFTSPKCLSKVESP